MNLTEAILHRWSPREFCDRPIDIKILKNIFDEVRWAQSSYNEQPWRFLLALKSDDILRQQLESYLVEGNYFAKDAYVLGIAFAKTKLTADGRHNAYAEYDVGAACQILALKCFAMGLFTRFMAGFDREKSMELALKDMSPIVMFAIGHIPNQAKQSPPPNRTRRPTSDLVFVGGWDNPLS